MEALQKQYFNCCDRLYLNGLAQEKMPTSQKIKKLIQKDKRLKKELERKLGL